MATASEFRSHPLFLSFTAPKYSDEHINVFLSMAEAELEGDRSCMGTQFTLICFLLAAHRLTRWSVLSLGNSSTVESLSLSEIREVVDSLSVSDEAGSESINFRSQPASDISKITGGFDPEQLGSTTYGAMYLTLYSKNRCVRSWMVT